MRIDKGTTVHEWQTVILSVCTMTEGHSTVILRVRTMTEGLSLDEGASLLHSSFGLLQSVFGPFLRCFHQLLHLQAT